MCKHLISGLVVLLIAMTWVSCTPDPVYSYSPEYEGKIRFTNDAPKTITLDNQQAISFVTKGVPGDSLTALMRVEYTGALITRADYYWTLKGDDGSKIAEEKIEQIAPHKQLCPPLWRFQVPDSAGVYHVHFRVEYNYSAQLESGFWSGNYPSGSTYLEPSTIKATLMVR